MPREVVTIQVGQCGNQIGCRFWDLALQEHAATVSSIHYDDALASFFRNVDSRTGRDITMKGGIGGKNTGGGIMNSGTDIKTLKARAVLVDMESGVLDSLLKGPFGDLFDGKQLISDVSGAGNNWAHGFHHYGPQYRKHIQKSIRRAVELCDSLQCFLILQSVGGGTGSGVGTYIMELLADDYPEYFRFASCVTPSREDDVITSPYNSMLAMSKLIDFAHCVLPVNNDSLISLVNRISASSSSSGAPSRGLASAGGTASNLLNEYHQVVVHSKTPNAQHVGLDGSQHVVAQAGPTKEKKTPFGDMNLLVAQLLNHLTASMRFSGSLNLDLNEITMNLVPYPRMHFLNSSLSPLSVAKDLKLEPRTFEQMFADVALKNDNSLTWNSSPNNPNPNSTVPIYNNEPLGGGFGSSIANPGQNINPRDYITLAQAFLVRSGDAGIADVTRNVLKVKEKLKFLPFNEDAVKIGLCGSPPFNYKHSCLGLTNSCGIVPGLLGPIRTNFERLYRRKAHVHHYTEFMEIECFENARENLRSLIEDYSHVNKHSCAPKSSERGIGSQKIDWKSVLFQSSTEILSQAALERIPRPILR